MYWNSDNSGADNDIKVLNSNIRCIEICLVLMPLCYCWSWIVTLDVLKLPLVNSPPLDFNSWIVTLDVLKWLNI